MIRRYYAPPQTERKSRFPDQRDANFLRFIRQQPCCVSGVRSGDLIEVPLPNGKTGKVRAIIEGGDLLRSRAQR